MENYPDFEIQHDLKGFIVKAIWKVSQRRQTVLIISCRSGSATSTIPNIANVFAKLKPSRGI